jgi:hypothetical protein
MDYRHGNILQKASSILTRLAVQRVIGFFAPDIWSIVSAQQTQAATVAGRPGLVRF